MGSMSGVDRKGYPVRYSLRPHEARGIAKRAEAAGGLTTKEIKGLAIEHNVASKVVFHLVQQHGIEILQERAPAPEVAVSKPKPRPKPAEVKTSPVSPKEVTSTQGEADGSVAALEEIRQMRKNLHGDRAALQVKEAALRRDRIALNREWSRVEALKIEAELIIESDADLGALNSRLQHEREARIFAEEELANAKQKIAELEAASHLIVSTDNSDLPESMMIL